MRIRIALSLGALLLAGGAVMGTALASAAEQPSAPSTTLPTQAPSAKPADPGATTAPAPPREARPVPGPDGRPGTPPEARRVPIAVPAGPVGDLHLPAIVEGAGN